MQAIPVQLQALMTRGILLCVTTATLGAQPITYVVPETPGGPAAIRTLPQASRQKDALTPFERDSILRANQQCATAAPLILTIRNSFQEGIHSVLLRYVNYAENTVQSVGVPEVIYSNPQHGNPRFPPGSMMILGPSPQISEALSTGTGDIRTLCQSFATRLLPASATQPLLVEVDSITLDSGTVIGKDDFGVIRRQQARQSAFSLLLNTIEAAKRDRITLERELNLLVSHNPAPSAWNLRGTTDFGPIEATSAARFALRGLQSGMSLEQLTLSLKTMLEQLSTKEMLRRQTQ